jgi:type II secretory pathway pseudopilin PulG
VGRLKARLATSEFDREMHTQLAVAEKALVRALQACRQALQSRGVERRRAQDTLRLLAQVTLSVQRIGHLTPTTEHDPDLVPESQKPSRKLVAKPVPPLQRRPVEDI